MIERQAAESERLVRQLRFACWAALLIVAAMASASYFLLDSRLALHQRERQVLMLAREQRTLSQSIVFLVREADIDLPDRPKALADLRKRTADFERNYDELLRLTDVGSPAGNDPVKKSVQAIFFGSPHQLDHFSTELAAVGRRFYAASAHEAGASGTASYASSHERERIDSILGDATLGAYAALIENYTARTNSRIAGLLVAHRVLYAAMLVIVALIGLLVFRPMTNAIARRTAELVEARNSMAHIAAHDGLTGLHNRAFLLEHFEALIRTARRRGERLAVVQIDLDRFKQINDSLGHAAGDFVLVETARRIRETCRASDMTARLGGDEFLLILAAAGSSEDIADAATRVLARLNEPVVFEGATVQPGTSAGIAVYPVDGENARDLFVFADLALYSAKKNGRGSFSFFSEELRRELEHRKALEHDLKQAIAAESFTPFFQPQVSISTGRITGVEALVRWRHPDRGMISPGEFIPVAEKSGLMAQIGRIVLRKAIAEAAGWQQAGLEFGRLAINVSGSELREEDFAPFLFGTLEQFGLPPERLSLEIVESVILDDEKTGIAAKLRSIRAAGIHLELDDFGTGYASLSHVNPNEIDRLKIDRRFVQNLDRNGDNAKIVRALTELARGLGLSIIAEGAETAEELDSLLAAGCDQVQGYSIAFPMPAGETADWLLQRQPEEGRRGRRNAA